MESTLQSLLYQEMIHGVRELYLAAPETFKNSPEMYHALRAADKAKLFMEGDLEGLVEMEREDAKYWRQRYLAATAATAAATATAQEARQNVILNPEDEDDDVSAIIPSCASSTSISVPSTPCEPRLIAPTQYRMSSPLDAAIHAMRMTRPFIHPGGDLGATRITQNFIHPGGDLGADEDLYS